jgi:hypothetical protein
MKHHNRRKFHRIKYDSKANVTFINDDMHYCQIKNLSLTGMFVQGNFQQQHAENCSINIFDKTKSKKINLRASAEVIWENDKGIAFKFTSMTFDSYMLLVSTLINNAEQPAIILHEFPKSCPYEITNDDGFTSERNEVEAANTYL